MTQQHTTTTMTMTTTLKMKTETLAGNVTTDETDDSQLKTL